MAGTTRQYDYVTESERYRVAKVTESAKYKKTLNLHVTYTSMGLILTTDTYTV
jgi:hypothetical protein